MAPVRMLLAGVLLLTGCTGSPVRAPADDGASRPVADRSTPTRTPSPTASPAPVTRLLVVGDIMLGRRVAVPGRPVAPLRHLAGRIRRADIAASWTWPTPSTSTTPSAASPASWRTWV